MVLNSSEETLSSRNLKARKLLEEVETLTIIKEETSTIIKEDSRITNSKVLKEMPTYNHLHSSSVDFHTTPLSRAFLVTSAKLEK